MAVKSVDLPELGTVLLYKRRGTRSLRLTITHDGKVRVSLPYWLPYAAGVEYAKRQKDWIQSQQVTQAPLADGMRVGKVHTLRLIPETNRKTIATRITSNREVRVLYPMHFEPLDEHVQKAAQRASHRALKLQAEKLLPQRLRTLADQHGFTYRTVSVKQLKSRWGSCSSEKDIALNIFLMQLPWHLIDYVLLHELMHTQIMAHGRPFWSTLDGYVPNLKSIRREMKTYRPMLLAG